MKIYFAGSISAGRDDAKYYKEIIKILEEHGNVLTEHIADHTLGVDGEKLPEKVIHDRDLAWLRESDVLVGEVTIPSLGVGYEIGKATEWGKRVLLLHRENKKPLSSMLLGSDHINTALYETIDDARGIIKNFLS
jgi:hypothetical protein